MFTAPLGFAAADEPPAADAPAIDTVYFPAADGKTELVGYVFRPAGAGPHPAIVMLHGRAGPYSSRVNVSCTRVARDLPSPCNATTLSLRHAMWGRYWAAHGYLALHVDSFGPRGMAHGFGRHTHGAAQRAAVNELDVRPGDAEAALAYLSANPDVLPKRIMLQGWSNGGSTALNVMLLQAAAHTADAADGRPRFRAALAFYPGCGPAAVLSRAYRADTELFVFLAGDDEEVSPATCQRLLSSSSVSAGGPSPVVTLYPGASHDFDDPGRQRQSLEANRLARADVMQRAIKLLDALPSGPTSSPGH
ncbi:dienelactone hydrolase family protein [Herbaspirillum lusitanum]|uniref:Dienelactone hydrolase family protein n=1 Tax=Herbaspirillum lusitanum TaxID=213312 RepID=A0ABW9A7Y9_9BURK